MRVITGNAASGHAIPVMLSLQMPSSCTAKCLYVVPPRAPLCMCSRRGAQAKAVRGTLAVMYGGRGAQAKVVAGTLAVMCAHQGAPWMIHANTGQSCPHTALCGFPKP
eukprot:353925-Chlamydomonas_euryale.AAC.5